ncbi:MAG: alanine--tRNA ligase [Atopobiaceae bacterium]|jgi:alanyl-tRNA synthetase|nr:alanine--tRNA ligase [Atopobiaceae bacterium]
MSTPDYKTMTTAQIREDFLAFFEGKGCRRVASSSLVPDDPSLLLANAGMNQFKQYYLGAKTMAEIGATSCQKCLRTNDIDNIGDSRHLSFFEMLGNFSFGGYTKADACAWAFEFITSPEHLGLPLERLYFTVYTDDDEGHDVWRALGVPEDHISRLGADDNFWAAGPTGPCGPCSEIYFDEGPEFGCGKPTCAPGCDCDRYLEFWNLVFTQYDRQKDGSFVDLPHRNIDTGMGLERIAAIMQHAHTNYDGDLLRGLISVGEGLAGKTYGADASDDRSLRILADHSRAVTFMIADGILPSNEGRGYVLRRLLRRAVYHGRILGIQGSFLTGYAHEATRLLGSAYPELVEGAALVDGIIGAEEQRFSATLEVGRAYLDDAMDGLEPGQALPGEVAFTLHDTYGFPIDLTREIAQISGHAVDMGAFDRLMEEQRQRGRAQVKDTAWSNANNVWLTLSDRIGKTEFVGYDHDEARGCEVLAMVRDGSEARRAHQGEKIEVVLDRTPFYAEMGGQVGDTGTLAGLGFDLRVVDTKVREGLVSHVCEVASGELAEGCVVTASVDRSRRELIRRNHTATHLLDQALKQVLGDHVHQAGSLVTPERLRFDFTHFEAVKPSELAEVERIANAQIVAAKPVVTKVMGIDEAKASGAIALFGEKYGDVVRVVSVGEGDGLFSRELCGGTHARNSAEIGLVKIVSEGSVGADVRRIEAVTSQGAIDYVNGRLGVLDAAAAALRCRPVEVPARIEASQKALKEGERRLRAALTGAASDQVGNAISHALKLDGFTCVLARFDGFEAADLRGAWDTIRDKVAGPVACVLATRTPDGKVALIAAGTEDAVKAGFGAGAVIKAIAEKVGGRGGGRPNMAQAGGRDAGGIDDALALARGIIEG